jgi:opacity protein-like surface antigen
MRLFQVLTTMLALTALGAHAASAQQPRANRPYRGLFGGGVGETEQSLSVSGSLGGGYDDNILAEGTGVSNTSTDPRTAKKGTLGSGNGSVSYSLNRDRVGLSVSVASSSRYYPNVQPRFVSGHTGGLDLQWRVGRKTSLSATASVVYQPFTLSGLFPTTFDAASAAFNGVGAPIFAPLVAPDLDLAASPDQYLMRSAGLGVSQSLTRRTSIAAGFSRQQSDSAAYAFDNTNDNVFASYRFQVSSGIGYRLGYSYRESRFDSGAGRQFRNHNLDLGVDYNKALSFSRRTTLAFGTGSGFVSDGTNTQFQVLGNARLNHEIGRTWNAAIAYARGFNFIETLRAPVLTDSVTAEFGGLVNRRLQFTSSAQASIGQLGLSSAKTGFDTYHAGAGLSYAVTRYVSLDANYSAYRYSFEAQTLLPPGVANNVNRQSLRASLSLWAPIFQRSRRPNVTR